MNKLKIALIILVLSFTLFHCTNEEENPVPQILSVSPTSIVAHLPEFTLTVNGQGFIEGSAIIFDGKEKTTSFISGSQLSCQISPDDTMINIVSGNTYADEIKNMEKPVSITIRNPAPGGGNSTPANFAIKENFDFESPRRLFDPITNGVAGPIVIDKDDDMYLKISEIEINKYILKSKSFLSTSDDGGETWSSLENIVNRSDLNIEHLLVDEYGNIHFFYTDFRSNSSAIFYKRKNKGENTWSEPFNIVGEDKSMYQTYLEEGVVIRGDKIFVFWAVNTRSYAYYIAFSFSEDNGKSWSSPGKLKNLGYIGWIQALLTDKGTLHLVFGKAENNRKFDVDIHTSSSNDNGKTWSDTVMISNGAGRSYFPQISYSGAGEKFNVFWILKKTGQIGQSVITGFKRKKWEMAERSSPEIDRPIQSNVTIPPSYHLKMRGTEDDGNSWGTVRNIVDFVSTDAYFNMHFFVKTDTVGNINLVVNEESLIYGMVSSGSKINSENIAAYFTRSIDGGLNWTSPVRFSDDPEFIAEYMNSDSKGNVYILLNKYDLKNYFAVEPYFSKSIK